MCCTCCLDRGRATQRGWRLPSLSSTSWNSCHWAVPRVHINLNKASVACRSWECRLLIEVKPSRGSSLRVRRWALSAASLRKGRRDLRSSVRLVERPVGEFSVMLRMRSSRRGSEVCARVEDRAIDDYSEELTATSRGLFLHCSSCLRFNK